MSVIYIEDFPAECIEDCGKGPGSKDEAVSHWASDPAIAAKLAELDPDRMRRCLKGYGAWEDEELQDDDTNRERILWLACSDFAEWDGTEDSASGSDIFCVE